MNEDMFGNPINNSASGNLFGNPASTAASTGGLFGAVTSTAGSTGNLFGTATSTAESTGGLFGTSGTNSSGATQPATNSLFGPKLETTQAQTGGLFAATQSISGGLFGTAQPASGGLFGSAQPAPGSSSGPTQSASRGLFGITQPASGSLFGTTQSASGSLFGTTQSASGGLFGTTQSAPGGLFGSAQPASGSLFGQAPVNSQPPSSGLFNTANSNSTTTTGLFGNTTASQPAQATGLFSSTTAVSQPQQINGSLFGQTSQNQNQSATSLFGNFGHQNNQPQSQPLNSATNPLNNNGLSLSQPLNQQQQTVPGVLIDTSNIRGTTRLNDLKEELQKQIFDIDSMIQAQIQLKNDCDAIMPAHDSQLTQIPIDVEFCQRKLIGVDNAADSDIHAISSVQKLIKSDVEAAKLSFAAIDILRLPPQYHMSGVWSPKTKSRGSGEASDIVGFFSQTADELDVKLSTYKKYIGEIEQHLRGVEANSAHQINILVAKKNGNSSTEESSFDQLAGVLRDFENGLLNVAGKVGATRKGVTALQLNQFSSLASNAT